VPLQNRVTPWGEFLAVPERGRWMGNRGILHDDAGRLGRRRWTHKAWLICRLHFKDRRRVVMAPGRYTELFFLDEATAQAAGHRPCCECRRQDFHRFASCLAAGLGLESPPRAGDVDARLHAERVAAGRRAAVQDGPARRLPDGAFVLWPAAGAALVWRGRLWRWAPGGYGRPGIPLPSDTLRVLTPATTLAAIAGGYRPQVDGSLADM